MKIKQLLTHQNIATGLKHIPFCVLLLFNLFLIYVGLDNYVRSFFCTCQQHLLPSDLNRLVSMLVTTLLEVFLIFLSMMIYSMSLWGATFVLGMPILFVLIFSGGLI